MTRKVFFAALTVLASAASWAQTITTFAGNGQAGFSGDGGPATQAMINRVDALAVDGNGNVYMADERNNRVRKVDKNGVITTFAGAGTPGFSGDGGPAAQAQLNAPTGVCTDTAGNVYINDISNFRVRKVSPSGVITTVAGNGQGSSVIGTTFGTLGDGGPATNASFSIVIRCATDRAGNLFVVDQGAHCVRKIDTGGTISTFAGHCVAASNGYSGDGGPATSAVLNNPTALAFDAPGNLYIVDQSNHRIRRVDSSGTIQTVAGSGSPTFSGDGGSATAAGIPYPGSVVVDPAGNLFIVDSVDNRIREVTGTTINTIAGTGAPAFGGDNGPPLQAMLNSPFGITLDASGNLYIADSSNNRVRKISGVAAGSGPFISSAGVTNGASFQTGIAPGGIVTIFGSNLGASSGQVLTASGGTWSTSLSGITVTMDGAAVPVYRVLNLNGQEQLSVQAPFSLNGKSTTQVAVSNAAGTSPAVSVPVLGAQPGIFILDGASNGAVHADGSIVTSANPASHGETVVLYLTGLGPVSSAPQPGQPASLTTLSNALVSPQVSIGGFLTTPAFAGLTPGFIGLYQINVAIPAAASAVVDVTVQANGVTSNTAKIPIR
jgi:uncharacterized protein (TIGR03437 family)